MYSEKGVLEEPEECPVEQPVAGDWRLRQPCGCRSFRKCGCRAFKTAAIKNTGEGRGGKVSLMTNGGGSRAEELGEGW